MRLAVGVVIVACAACGRFSFDRRGDAGLAGDATPTDVDLPLDALADGAVDAALPPIALVQQMTNEMTATGTINVALTNPTTVGNTLVLAISTDTKITSIASVTGGGSLDWAEVLQVAGAGGSCGGCIRGALWHGTVSSPATTVIVTVGETAPDDLAASLTEWSGIGALESVASAGPITNSTTVVTTTVAPTHPTDLVLAMGAWDRAVLVTGPTNGFTALQPAIVPNNSKLYAAYTIGGAPTSTEWDVDIAAQSWIAIVATFQQ